MTAACRKIRYATRDLAELQARLIVEAGEAKALRVYGCREHGKRVWHLTSKRPQDSGKLARHAHNRKRRAAWELPLRRWEDEGGALSPRELRDICDD